VSDSDERRTQSNRRHCGESELETHVKLFCREGTGTNASSVGLDDTVDGTNRARRDTETGGDTSNASGRGGNEGVGSKVHVEHEGVGTLDEDALVVGESLVDEGNTVNNEGLQALRELLVSLDLALSVVPVPEAESARCSSISNLSRTHSKCP
jgi:hypothetical protein